MEQLIQYLCMYTIMNPRRNIILYSPGTTHKDVLLQVKIMTPFYKTPFVSSHMQVGKTRDGVVLLRIIP